MTDKPQEPITELPPVYDSELGVEDVNNTPEAVKDIEERIDIINEGLPDDENKILDGGNA